MEQQPVTPVSIPMPPLMQWREFADWIRMEHGVVRGWLDNGYIPTQRIGKHLLVNVALLSKNLLEKDDLV
ncbi:DNA-binding protein [Neptunomonas sp.]|uniref:DNA-binding protein n=1 Tax=Neptunomonas sp. TaxID=1971898 RepID=UPI0025DCF63D|nr:DNA-binding protein [Neptunomonas sp.]